MVVYQNGTAGVSKEPRGYGALITSGSPEIGARIIGAAPRQFTEMEVQNLREILAAGYAIQVIMPDRATFERHRASLYGQLGLLGEAAQ